MLRFGALIFGIQLLVVRDLTSKIKGWHYVIAPSMMSALSGLSNETVSTMNHKALGFSQQTWTPCMM